MRDAAERLDYDIENQVVTFLRGDGPKWQAVPGIPNTSIHKGHLGGISLGPDPGAFLCNRSFHYQYD